MIQWFFIICFFISLSVKAGGVPWDAQKNKKGGVTFHQEVFFPDGSKVVVKDKGNGVYDVLTRKKRKYVKLPDFGHVLEIGVAQNNDQGNIRINPPPLLTTTIFEGERVPPLIYLPRLYLREENVDLEEIKNEGAKGYESDEAWMRRMTSQGVRHGRDDEGLLGFLLE